MFKYLILFITLASCSREIVKSSQELLNDIPMDAGLKPLVVEFMSYCSKFNSIPCETELQVLTSVKYVSSFSDNPTGSIVGRTYFSTDGSRRIEIINSLNTSYYSLETLVFHECGHALLNRVHDKVNANTIMQPYMLYASYYNAHRLSLITDEIERSTPILSLLDSNPTGEVSYIDN